MANQATKVFYYPQESAAIRNFFELKNYSLLFVLFDQNTKKHCLPSLKNILPELKFIEIEIKAGEEYKTLASCEEIWDKMSSFQANRNSVLINLGGGVITDMGGFAAAAYKRGVSFVHVPTTFLAMIDASIGGKCGVNFQAYKNQLGLFKEADALLIFPDFINTLPKDQLKSGFAEAIKHALIVDKEYWEIIVNMRSFDQIEAKKIISRSIEIKQEVVKNDPLEKAWRKVLNFGHSIGHALESLFLEKGRPIPHGYAIAAGMYCEVDLSSQVLGFPQKEKQEIQDYIALHFDKLEITTNDFDAILGFLKQDKKNNSFLFNFTLLENVASPVIDQDIPKEQIENSLNQYLLQYGK